MCLFISLPHRHKLLGSWNVLPGLLTLMCPLAIGCMAQKLRWEVLTCPGAVISSSPSQQSPSSLALQQPRQSSFIQFLQIAPLPNTPEKCCVSSPTTVKPYALNKATVQSLSLGDSDCHQLITHAQL